MRVDGKDNGWIGVDLDGTLSHYVSGQGVNHIGKPIEEMLQRVKNWLKEKQDVRIFTARISRSVEAAYQTDIIEEWCIIHIGQILPITCKKDLAMIVLYDDRAVGVERNTGRLLSDAHDEKRP